MMNEEMNKLMERLDELEESKKARQQPIIRKVVEVERVRQPTRALQKEEGLSKSFKVLLGGVIAIMAIIILGSIVYTGI